MNHDLPRIQYEKHGRASTSTNFLEAGVPSGERVSNVAPAGSTQAGTDASQLAAAVNTARESQRRWGFLAANERAAVLVRAAKEMLARRAELIALAHEEIGKVAVEGLMNEAVGPLDAVNAWVRIVEETTSPRRVPLNPISFPFKTAQVELVPRGVVGIISPWNFPVAGIYRSVFPALLTGNAVLLKPSEHSPRTSEWFAERIAAELPAGVRGLISVVHGGGDAGAALIASGIDACVFTGSPETGRKVRVQCAERGIPCSAEMGGKDPAIVLADCDLPRTVAGITHWALSNAGQACGAIEVAYVDQRIADRFVEALRSAWTRLRAGNERFAEVARMANRRQFDVVCQHVEDAKAKGAVVVCGGSPEPGDGLVYPPTLLDRCDARMSVVRDETFGPVLAVVRVSGAAEAVRLANESRYGLGASIWSRDVARARRLGERLEYGIVSINNHSFTGAVPALPWSGTRDTGFGVGNSALSLATFARPRTLVVDRSQTPELFWMPYDQALWEMGELLADAQLGRIARAWRLPLVIRERLRTLRAFFRR